MKNSIYQTIAEYKSMGKIGMIVNIPLDPEITAALMASGYSVSEYSNGNTIETHINW